MAKTQFKQLILLIIVIITAEAGNVMSRVPSPPQPSFVIPLGTDGVKITWRAVCHVSASPAPRSHVKLISAHCGLCPCLV